MKKKVLCVVEVGWQGMREFSIFLAKSGILVDVIIKGRVSKEITDVITKYEGIKMASARRMLFRPVLLFRIIKERLSGNLKGVIISKKKTENWIDKICKPLFLKTMFLQEINGHYRLILNGETEVSCQNFLSQL